MIYPFSVCVVEAVDVVVDVVVDAAIVDVAVDD